MLLEYLCAREKRKINIRNAAKKVLSDLSFGQMGNMIEVEY